jgi:hypothetical protein
MPIMESAVVNGAAAPRRPHYWFAAFIWMAIIAASLVAVATAVA